MRHGPALEAPTHLGSHQLPLPPEWASDDDDAELPTGRIPGRRTPRAIAGSLDARELTERTAAPRPLVRDRPRGSARAREPMLDEGRRARANSRATPLPPPPTVAPRATPSPDALARAQVTTPGEPSQLRDAADPATPVLEAASPRVEAPRRARSSTSVAPSPPPGIGAIDPLQVVVPPELGAPIYGWVRRLALQADLAGADRVLRDALLDLTSSLAVAIVYPGADGLWTLGGDDELPSDATALVAVAEARRAVIASHTALIPIVTTTETVAVVVLTRNPRNPAYHPIEQIAMVALARETAAILHHLAVQHLERASEREADRGGLYRGEALEAQRTRGTEGAPVHLSPSWVKRTYPLLVATIVIALVASIFITVPTYSSGSAVVVLHGTPITAPAVGTVDQVLVKPGQHVKQGTVLVRLHSAEQEAELTSAQTDADNATVQYLFDQQDEQIKKTLAAALVRVERERARLETRLVRARKDGTVSDIRVQLGQLLQPGDHILQIVEPGAEPEIWAFLPGKDRPRLRESQLLQVELVGYTKTREQARIHHVAPEIIGGTEASKMIGAQLADSLKLQGGSWVFVRAKLPARSFRTEHRTYFFHHGMPAKVEVKIQSKPFLVTLLPALERYLPD